MANMEVRWSAVVNSTLARRKEVLDVVGIRDVWANLVIRLLSDRTTCCSNLSSINKKRCAVRQDVETALSATSVDKMYIQMTLAPSW
jgi:hypothetical protein